MEVWKNVNEFLGVDEDVVQRWWKIICDKYEEPQRYYHTLKHIEHMLKLFELHKNKISNQNAVVYAIIFHDIVYDPKAPDNEEKSAELFEKFAREAKLNENIIKPVTEWILETKKHTTPAHSQYQPGEIGDLHYVLDFDMEVLSWPIDDYEKYTRHIRQEYCHIPEEEFKSRRAQVLKIFLMTPYIYASPEFREQCEGPARENIRREISDLTGA